MLFLKIYMREWYGKKKINKKIGEYYVIFFMIYIQFNTI